MLTNGDSLVCGVSKVFFAARYGNVALERRLKELAILRYQYTEFE